jgi:hypothetical protein
MTIKALFPSSEPALELDFANTKALDPRVSFTRASTGTCVGADGLIKNAARGAARFDHGSTGESLGLLVEDAKTNLLAYSEDSQYWQQDGSGVVLYQANTTISPAGTLTGTSVTGVSGTYRAARRNLSVTNGTQYVTSVFVRGTGNLEMKTEGSFPGGLGSGLRINLATGVIVDQGNNEGIGVATFSNGWWRIFIVRTASSSGTANIDLNIYARTDTFQVWGWQAEVGSFPTSYIPTSGSTATRAADVATVSNTNSSIFPTSSFTTINSPFGTAGGGSTVKLVGPTIKRTAIYNGDLPQSQINALTGTDQWWRWRVTGATFALPGFTTNGNVTVDWGDGVVETMTTGVHTFLDNNVYHTIGFRLNSGTGFGFGFGNSSVYRTNVIAVGPMPANMKFYGDFNGCTNLRAYDASVTSYGGNLTNAWSYCSSLNSFPWFNASSVTALNFAWRGCTNLTTFPLIDTSSVTSFIAAWNFCQINNFPLINTSAATDIGGAWWGNTFTSFPLINTSSVQAFGRAWSSCSNLTSFPLINTSAGINFNATWENCSSLQSMPLINTSLGQNFSQAWTNCTSLTSFPALNFDSAVGLASQDAYIGFRDTWQGCTALANFPANLFNNTTCTRYFGAFTNCALTATSIENILVSINTANTSNGILNLNGGTNAGASTWTANAITAYNALISRGWTITRNA